MLDPSSFPLNVFSVPFRLIGMHIHHCKNKIQFFNFCLFHRLYRGSEVMVRSEDPLQIFLKGIFVQEGSSGTRFDHGQFEIKTFLIYTPPYCTCVDRFTKVTLYSVEVHGRGTLRNGELSNSLHRSFINWF